MSDDDTDAILDLLGPARPSLDAITSSGHSFSVPWSRQTIPMLTGFISSRMQDDSGPWILQSPFDDHDLKMNAIIGDDRNGSTSYRDGYSTQSASSTEHLSVALGVTVGYPFLNANVTVEYDKTVVKNESGVQASRNSSCRVGRVVLLRPPILSRHAIEVLQVQGSVKFQQMFGDFYVYGYEIGADAGACMSGSTSSTAKEQRLKVTVSVKVLWASASKSHTETHYDTDSSSSFTFCGYSTLESMSQKLSIQGGSDAEQANLQAAANEYLLKVACLDAEVRAQLVKIGLKNGQKIPLSKSQELCKSGLVVQLLLAPFARLNQYVSELGRPYAGGAK